MSCCAFCACRAAWKQRSRQTADGSSLTQRYADGTIRWIATILRGDRLDVFTDVYRDHDFAGKPNPNTINAPQCERSHTSASLQHSATFENFMVQNRTWTWKVHYCRVFMVPLRQGIKCSACRHCHPAKWLQSKWPSPTGHEPVQRRPLRACREEWQAKSPEKYKFKNGTVKIQHPWQLSAQESGLKTYLCGCLTARASV